MLQGYIEASEMLRKFAANTTGTTAIEFGLIVAGIATMCIPAIGIVGGQISEQFNTIRCEGFPLVCLVR